MQVNLEGCGLILMTTLGCNAHCGHCYLHSSPAKAKYRLSLPQMISDIREASRVGIRSVTFSGGEPFIFPQDLFEAIGEANELGMSISLRTNGFWAVNDKITERILTFLWCNCMRNIGLSYDNFHSEFVNLENILRIIRIAEDVDVPVWLDWIGNESKGEIWQSLGEYMRVVRAVVPSVRVGRAMSLDDGYNYLYPLESVEFEFCLSFQCGKPDELLLEVYPDGLVNLSGCCYANPRLLRERSKGEGWIEKLVDEVENDPAVDYLYRYGVGGLIRKAREEAPHLLEPFYTSDCEACQSLLGELFPVKKRADILCITSDGYKRGIHNLDFMPKRLCQLVDEASKDFVTDVKGGYMAKPKFGGASINDTQAKVQQ